MCGLLNEARDNKLRYIKRERRLMHLSFVAFLLLVKYSMLVDLNFVKVGSFLRLTAVGDLFIAFGEVILFWIIACLALVTFLIKW